MREHYCRDCKKTTEWVEGKALINGDWVSSDFPGDYSGPDVSEALRGQTITLDRIPARKLYNALKCKECGHSVSFCSMSELRRFKYMRERS
jgi:hypothetical protein